MGKFHSKTSNLNITENSHLEFRKEFNFLINEFDLNDHFIRKKIKHLRNKLDKVNLNKLKYGIIHGDCALEDFRFKEHDFSGLLDFGNARYDYYIYDIASLIVYLNIEQKEEKKKNLIKNYYKKSLINQTDLNYINLFVGLRLLDQILFHAYRFKEEWSQGLSRNNQNKRIIINYKKRLKEYLKKSHV